MRELMFKIPDEINAKKVVVTSGVIDGTEKAIIYRDKNRKVS